MYVDFVKAQFVFVFIFGFLLGSFSISKQTTRKVFISRLLKCLFFTRFIWQLLFLKNRLRDSMWSEEYLFTCATWPQMTFLFWNQKKKTTIHYFAFHLCLPVHWLYTIYSRTVDNNEVFPLKQLSVAFFFIRSFKPIRIDAHFMWFLELFALDKVIESLITQLKC